MIETNKFIQEIGTKLRFDKILVFLIIIISLWSTIHINNKIAAFGLILFLLIVPIVIKNTKTFLLLLISFKMIINTLYEVNVIGNINILQIIGTFMPLYLILYLLIKHTEFRKYPLFMLIAVLIGEILLSVIITFYGDRNINGFIKLLRVLNGLTCFFAFPLLFKTKKDIDLFMTAWLISTGFPLLVGLYQMLTGQLRFQIHMDLLRIAGLYHDVGTIAFSGLIFIIIMCYFLSNTKSRFKAAFIIAILFVISFLIYKTYSKAAAITLGILLILYAFYSRKYLFAIFAATTIILIFFTETSGIYKRIERDITVREKYGDRLMFTGRVGIWQRNIDRYLDYRPLQKFIGQSTVGAAHNDFLRMLLDHGMLGFLLYSSLLGGIFIKLFKYYRASTEREGKNLLFIALLTFVSYFLLCFSTTPSLYTDYQWFHWGLVGIALVHGRKLYETNSETVT